MVKKFFNMLNKEFSGITEAAFLLGTFALVSQILGLFRDRALAHYLGPSSSLDVYYTAFRVPDLIFNSVASLVSITVLIPFFIERLERDAVNKTHESKYFLNQVFTVFFGLIVSISLVAFILMPLLAPFLAPGFDAVQLKELVEVSRIMLLSPIFLGISNLFGIISQIFKRFFVYALAPVMYNLGIIIGIIFFYPKFGIYGLAYGVALGALLHLLIQLPVLVRHNFAPGFSFPIKWLELKNIFLLSLPRTLGLSINSFTLAIILAIASTVGEGSVSVFNFSFNLHSVPISIIGVSYSVAAFPALARAFSLGQIDLYKSQMITTARQIIFWSMPIIFLFIVLRAQIVRVILGSGSFTWADTKLTAASFAILALSVLAQSLIVLLVRGYYAAGETKRPLTTNLLFSVVQIFLAYALYYWFLKSPELRYFVESLLRVEDVPGTALLMLPLGYSIGTILNFFALWLRYRKDYLLEENSALLKTFFQVFSSSFFMAYTAYLLLGVFDNVFDINTFWGILGQGFFSGLIGIFVGIFFLKMLGSKEFKEVEIAFRHKFWKSKVIAPNQTQL